MSSLERLLFLFFAPFLVTCIFTLIGFFTGRAYGRRQGYIYGWVDRDLELTKVPSADYSKKGVDD